MRSNNSHILHKYGAYVTDVSRQVRVEEKNVFRSRRDAKCDDDVLIFAGSALRALAAAQEMRCRRV